MRSECVLITIFFCCRQRNTFCSSFLSWSCNQNKAKEGCTDPDVCDQPRCQPLHPSWRFGSLCWRLTVVWCSCLIWDQAAPELHLCPSPWYLPGLCCSCACTWFLHPGPAPDLLTWLLHLASDPPCLCQDQNSTKKEVWDPKQKNPNLQTSYILELQRGLTVCTWAQLWMDPTSLRVMDQSLCVLHLREPYRETLCRHTQLSLLKCTWTVHGKCFGNENCKNKQTNKGKARQVTLQRSEGKSLLVPLPLERHFMRTSFGERRKGRTADPYCKVKLWLPNLWL